jgi:hypothetical protein
MYSTDLIVIFKSVRMEERHEEGNESFLIIRRLQKTSQRNMSNSKVSLVFFK